MVASTLLRAFAQSGLRAAGMKPVASGGAGDRTHEDVAALMAAANVSFPVELVNPYCFELAIAPHLAAQQAGGAIDLARIRECYVAIAARVDRVVVEGAGGLLVPLGPGADFGDLARLLELSVVLVVGMRLGCLNHALLTAEAIRNRGLPFAGWVANRVEPAMPFFEDNLHTLRQRLPAPLLGVVPFAPDQVQACAAMNIDLLVATHS